ncbi:hypothetical protein HDU83_000022 [Entophlyctis luteolus]|nr:hypothetical protein HDU82_003549 [Entophlyctis luteolus]KAJ3357965.1 hypothetical protein HDU83_000022 [Entophlyctis luteolus]KAJ3395242.1 hypothetical protein HDU84_000009 [Entophlyctis sp. JEL0112]
MELRDLSLTDMIQTAVIDHPAATSFVIFLAVFYALGVFLEICDRNGYLSKHKHFRGSTSSPTFKKMIPTVVFNQVAILFPAMLVFSYFGGYKQPQQIHSVYATLLAADPTTLSAIQALNRSATANFLLTGTMSGVPTWYHIAPLPLVVTLLLAAAIHEVLFYVFHRYLLHTRFGYIKLNHKLHHSAPTHSAISAFYMSPADFCFEILVPYLASVGVPVALGICNPVVAVAMLGVGTVGGMYEHSGYNFWAGVKGMDTVVHALHHQRNDCSFADGVGAPSVLDEIFGTACASGASAVLKAAAAAATATVKH